MLPPERVYWSERGVAARLSPLRGHVRADAVVVGGGVAGLSGAERLMEQGLRVVLLEAGVCGGGATGRSSGFITPDSELQVTDLARRFGDAPAARLYSAVRDSCDRIRRTISRYRIECGLVEADCLYAASGRSTAGTIREEHRARLRLGLESSLLEGSGVRSAVGTDAYPSAVRYGGTFGMSGAGYATGLRDALRARGAAVFEGSAVTGVAPGRVETDLGTVHAEKVLICVDRFAPALGLAARDVHAARAYLLLTEPLPRAVMESLFPGGPLMVWDTDLIYQYFRPTADGRLLIGGGALWNTYAPGPVASGPVHEKLAAYIRRVFPALRTVRFTHRWEGLIGVSKDILPIAGAAPRLRGMYYALSGAGIPWAALAGRIAADCALGGAVPGFGALDPRRAFTTIDPLQPVLGKRAMWMLGNYLAKNVERGGSERVRVRQRLLLGSLAAAGIAGIYYLGARYGCKRR